MRIYLSFSLFDRIAYFGLLALIFSLPFSPALSEICSVTLLASWLITQASPAYRSFWRKLPVWLWMVLLSLCLWGIAVSAISFSPWGSLKGCISKWGEWFLLGIAACSTLSTPKRLENFLKIAVVSSFVILLDGFWQYFFGYDFLRHRELLHGFFPSACFPHYTHYAAYLAVFFILGVGLNLRTGLSKIERSVLTIHNALFFLMLMMTFCRGAWLGAAAGFFGLTFLRDKRICFLAAAGLVILFFLSSLSAVSLTFRFDSLISAFSADDRLQRWKDALRLIQDHLWTGVGINNFVQVYARYYWDAGYAHNSFLQFAGETGLPGLVLLVGWFAGVLGWAGFKLRQASESWRAVGWGVFFAAVALLIHSFFDNLLFNQALAPLLWILLGTLVSVSAESGVLAESRSK